MEIQETRNQMLMVLSKKQHLITARNSIKPILNIIESFMELNEVIRWKITEKRKRTLSSRAIAVSFPSESVTFKVERLELFIFQGTQSFSNLSRDI